MRCNLHPFCFLLLLVLCLTLAGCGSREKESREDSQVEEEETGLLKVEPLQFTFADVQGRGYRVELQTDWPLQDYDTKSFSLDQEGRMTYGDPAYQTQVGIDVSAYQGEIDWQKVKEAGIDFAILRIGFRGYGEAGNLVEDACFRQNYAGAKAAGIPVGVYFFSQAVTEEEAVEEADFAINLLEEVGSSPDQLDLPIVFDPETIPGSDARTDGVTGDQFTANCRAFCDRVEEEGYCSMIYANMLWEAYKLDLGELSAYDMWYADYASKPQTPYAFTMWQYTEEGNCNGISGFVDMDLWLLKTK